MKGPDSVAVVFMLILLVGALVRTVQQKLEREAHKREKRDLDDRRMAEAQPAPGRRDRHLVFTLAQHMYTFMSTGDGKGILSFTPAFDGWRLSQPTRPQPDVGDVIAIYAGLGIIEYRVIGVMPGDWLDRVEVQEMPWRDQPDAYGANGG